MVDCALFNSIYGYNVSVDIDSTLDPPKQPQKALLFDFAAVSLTFSITFAGREQAGIPLSLKDKRWNLHPPYNSLVFTLWFQLLHILFHRAGLWQTCLSRALKCQETNKLSFSSRLTFLELQCRIHIHLFKAAILLHSRWLSRKENDKLHGTLWASCLSLISDGKDGIELDI